jgi:uncharacterized protein (TIGR02271 family)
MAKAQAVIGVFKNSSEADAVTDDLKRHGFETRDIESISRTTTGLAGGAGAAMAAAAEFDRIDISDEERRHYEEKLSQGRSIVIARAGGDRAREAADIMMRHGAVREEAHEGLLAEEKLRGETLTGRQALERETTIPIVEEEFKVGKREVHRGGVRVYAHTEEVPVEEEVTLRDERVTVERRHVNRPATPGMEAPNRVVEVSETVEVPVISKEARVVEEVVIRKETSEHKEKIKDTIKKTQIDVQNASEEEERFGREFAADRRYAGRDWGEIEQHLKRSWEEKHAGTWNDVKERFQSGWRSRFQK